MSSDAFRYALRLLSYRGRSRAELQKKLAGKGFGPQEAGEALSRLEALGYINDSALAESLSGQARERKLLGRRAAAAFMAARGVPKGITQSALEDYDELPGALKLAGKKLRAMDGLAPEVQARRLSGALARRGYSTQTIRKVFSTRRISDE